jgi:hypothetical protein
MSGIRGGRSGGRGSGRGSGGGELNEMLAEILRKQDQQIALLSDQGDANEVR